MPDIHDINLDKRDPKTPTMGLIEGAILLCGAIIGSLLTLWLIGYLFWAILQSFPAPIHSLSLKQRLLSILYIVMASLLPASGAVACIKAIFDQRARWPAFAAIPAAIIGGTLMFLAVGVGWHYHPDQEKRIGILMIGVTGCTT